jgi:hypothetical protein
LLLPRLEAEAAEEETVTSHRLLYAMMATAALLTLREYLEGASTGVEKPIQSATLHALTKPLEDRYDVSWSRGATVYLYPCVWVLGRNVEAHVIRQETAPRICILSMLTRHSAQNPCSAQNPWNPSA